ncbi:MAG: outer membrane protein assembly factor BamB family protein [Planctomycetota bacterium]|jgi:outer membrane protein assembly factor BamB
MIPIRQPVAIGRVLLLVAVGGLLAAQGSARAEDGLLAGDRPVVRVHIGLGDDTFDGLHAKTHRSVVHVLESDAAKIDAARRLVRERGLSGVCTVEQWSGRQLPYADNLANVVVVEGRGGLSERELLRVVAPGGALLTKRGRSWSRRVKPVPEGFDGWPHWHYGADGNFVSHDTEVSVPTGLRWVAGPPQDKEGERWYYDHLCLSAAGRNFYAFENRIIARDAYNGVLLWEKRMRVPSYRERGTDVPKELMKKFKVRVRTSKARPVAHADLLYVAADGKLLALDGGTGETRTDFGAAPGAREILVSDGMAIVSGKDYIRAHDLKTASRVWRKGIDSERILAGDAKLFVLADKDITCLELKSGKELWRTTDPNADPATTCTYHYGVLALEKSSWRDDAGGCGLLVYSGRDGKLLWTKNYEPDKTHFQEARAYFAQGLLWLQEKRNKLVGYEPRTGKRQKSWRSRGKHCSTPVATERYFIAAECEFTDFRSGERDRARMFRAACRNPFIPANGLLYTFPVQCECFPMLRGYMALQSSVWRDDRSRRFVRGGRRARRAAEASDPEDEWPMYRHDVHRTGSTECRVPEGEIRIAWRTNVAEAPASPAAASWRGNPFVRGIVTPPVAACGKVFVAAPDEHRVVALDAGTGKEAWAFAAGGRIDSPPTIHEGLCLFGSHDGWVYCVDVDTGDLVWRYRAAPVEARIMAYGQMESPWPVPGNILVDEGIAYFAAGRHPRADGGVHVHALDAVSGRVVWARTVKELELEGWYGPKLPGGKGKLGVDFEPVDMLVRDGDRVAMSRWRFDRRTGNYRLELGSITYDADGLEVPRGLWGYGIRQIKILSFRPGAVVHGGKVHVAEPGETALLFAGGVRVSGDKNGKLAVRGRKVELGCAPVHDGLIAAYGRIYVATRDGEVVCIR